MLNACVLLIVKSSVTMFVRIFNSVVVVLVQDSTFKTVVLAIHLCGVLGFAIAISVQIGITAI